MSESIGSKIIISPFYLTPQSRPWMLRQPEGCTNIIRSKFLVLRGKTRPHCELASVLCPTLSFYYPAYETVVFPQSPPPPSNICIYIKHHTRNFLFSTRSCGPIACHCQQHHQHHHAAHGRTRTEIIPHRPPARISKIRRVTPQQWLTVATMKCQ